MDRFDEIGAFVGVAEAKSFTQAARRLGVSSAQVGDAALARRQRLGDRAHVLVGHIADAPLERLMAPAVVD
mgnify:CR=1 FL=1